MRNINFIEVGMENFGPYIDPMILKFENNNLVLITGPNGIGKTMSLEAIPFTLFGETSKGAKGDDVVNTRVGKNCHTWVKFLINDDTYIVDRYHKYTKLGNTVTIIKNKDENPYVKGHREVLPEVEKLICSKKSFINTLMFGQKVKDFFTDLIDSDKKEIFRKILTLEIYTVWYKEADNDLKAIKQKIQQLLSQIGIEKGILANTDVQIDILFKQFNEFKEVKKEKIRTLKNSIEDNRRLFDNWIIKQQELKVEEHDVKQLQININDVERQITHYENEKATTFLQLKNSASSKTSEMNAEANKGIQGCIENNRKAFNDILEIHDGELKKLSEEITIVNQLKTDNVGKISTIETEMRICQKDIDNITRSLEIEGGECPTCLRDIDDECRSHLESEALDASTRYHSFKNQLEEINKSQKINNSKLDDIVQKENKLHELLVETKRKIQAEEQRDKQQIQEKLDAAIQKINELERSETIKIERDYAEYVSNLRIKLDKLNKTKEAADIVAEKIKEIDLTISKIEQSIAGAEIQLKIAEDEEYDKSQLAAYQIRKVELNKSIKEMEEDVVNFQKEETVTSFWKAAWSPTGIPSMLIDESIPFMNKKVAEYLNQLSNGRYIVSFDTLAETKAGEFRDKISVNVLDTYTRANSRVQLSGGQTRLVDIATILTLGDLQSNIQDVNINILLFDEIFDSLDEENIGFVSKILSKLKVGKSIYLISHTQVDQLEADEVLELR